MAVTKIWPVRGRLDHPIAYAMNPEKTDAKLLPDSLDDVMNYAVNEEKTEKKFYVSGINCNPVIARSEFQIVKEQYGKPGGIIVYHAYQSFSEGEVTPAEAHRIGMEFAKMVWGDKYQVVVATHLNTHCLHNHFVVNSVSFRDGKRCRQKQWTELSRISDEICKEHQLSIVERHGKGLPQKLAKAEKAGAPTRLVIAREALDEGLTRCCNLRELKSFLFSLGYICQFDDNRKYWTIRQRDWKRPIRLVRMGEQYTNEAIRERLRSNSTEVRKAAPVHRRVKTKKRARVRKKTNRKIGGLRGLYCHYCYLLGYYPKRRAKFYRVSPLLRDDLLKLNYISQEAKLLQKYQIDTMEQLLDYRESLVAQVERLSEDLVRIRKAYQSSDAFDVKESLVYAAVSESMKEVKVCRQQIALCDRIEFRSAHIKETLRTIEFERHCRKRAEKNR